MEVFILMHRAAPELTSTFISVLEPYQSQPFIKSVKQLNGTKENEVTIRIELTDGTTDYILYNPVEQKASLSNGISMNGTLGYIKEKNNRPVKGILINGTSLKYRKMDLKSDGTITGKVVKMNKELSGGGWLMVDTKLSTDGSLIGEQIIIDTDADRDASYTIRNIERVGDLTKINCGPIAFVRDYARGDHGSQNIYCSQML
jgi:oligo-alginate lyase